MRFVGHRNMSTIKIVKYYLFIFLSEYCVWRGPYNDIYNALYFFNHVCDNSALTSSLLCMWEAVFYFHKPTNNLLIVEMALRDRLINFFIAKCLSYIFVKLTVGQFHQHFTRSFWANIPLPKFYNAKLYSEKKLWKTLLD